jgi:hypothetical protein
MRESQQAADSSVTLSRLWHSASFRNSGIFHLHIFRRRLPLLRCVESNDVRNISPKSLGSAA